MIKKYFYVLSVLALAAAGAQAANNLNFDMAGGNSALAALSPAKAALSVPRSVPANYRRGRSGTWTIMVYINGKNNLEKYGFKDVNEMEMVGSSDRVKVVVELGKKPHDYYNDGSMDKKTGRYSDTQEWSGARRYLVQKDNNPSEITSPVLQEISDVDMGDWKHLVDFVSWAKANYKSDNYMLIVWNHGSGWVRSRGLRTLSRGISFDDETHNHITTPQLGQALRQMGGVNIYASDACLMQMAEVDYEIKDSADFIVGSEESEPGDGWTYDLFLNKLANEPALTPRNVAMHAVDAYAEHYVSINQKATQSAVDTGYLRSGEMTARLNAWTDAVVAANNPQAIKSARAEAQSYAYADNKSLAHFVNLVGKKMNNPQVTAAGNALISFIQDKLVIDNKTNQFPNSRGLAIYIPNASFDETYNALVFAHETKWAAFAKWVAGL